MNDLDEKPRLRMAVPLFLVKNLHEAIQYYTLSLGFELEFTYDDYYASIERDGIHIHIQMMRDFVPHDARRKEAMLQDLWIEVGGVKKLFEEMTTRDARIVTPLNLKPWSSLEFTVKDLDGNRICFSELQG